MKKAYYILGLIICLACTKKPKSDLYFTFLDASQTGIDFNNQIVENDSINFYNNEYMYIGSGIGVADFNKDGLQDVIFGASQLGSKLYINEGDFAFKEISDKAGIEAKPWITGISIVDINQDGWQDIYLCVSHFKNSNDRKNLLYINQGLIANSTEPTFVEEAEKYGLADTGFSSQAAFFDYDSDGDLDMYLVNHKLFEPQPNKLVPIDSSGKSASADKLYQNNYPKLNFSDVSIQSGIVEDGYGLGVSICDFNLDGFPDVYVANDYLSNDYFWQNLGNGKFKNGIKSATKHQSFSSMGLDAADINNDALPDLAVLDMMPNINERKKMMVLGFSPEKFEMQRSLGYEQQFSRNMLQLHQGISQSNEPKFSEVGHLAEMAETDWSWSVLLADFDNDTWRDMHISNGLARDLTNNDFISFTQESQSNEYSFGGGIPQISKEQIKNWQQKLEELGAVSKPNYLFTNKKARDHKELGFDDISEAAGLIEPSVSQGTVYADFDNDGDLDLMVNNMNQKAFVMRNEVRKSKEDINPNFIRIQFQGSDINRNGFGAKVRIVVAGQVQYAEQFPVRGYASTIDNRMHFGIRNAKIIDTLEVFWPNGKYQILKNIKGNTELILKENQAVLKSKNYHKASITGSKLFVEDSGKTLFTHRESPFFDYYNRRLQPQKFSQLGPCMAKGDLNGDGLEDVVVGGAAFQSASIFLQNKAGNYTNIDLETSAKFEEDLGIEIFDADNDKDLDVLVVGGSTEYQRGNISCPRLFINNGQPNPKFSKSSKAFPSNIDVFSSTIAVNDYDNDGDNDVFIGGRINKENFPTTPKSYFYENTKGVFKDQTAKICPELSSLGMVTDALWMDIDGDQIKELVVAGEYMPIQIFKNHYKKLKPQINDFKSGMWRGLSSADIDNDGDLDLIAGNIGNNNKYHVSTQRPFKLFAKDLDNSGSVELLPAYYIKNSKGEIQLFPDFDRYQIAEQTPIIKKKYLLHSDFSKATMGQLLDDLGRENLMEFSFETTESVWYENVGKGKFVSHKLPIEAQFAPINSILAKDFDDDGQIDLLLGGNEYQTEVSTGRTDASNGLFLKGLNKEFVAKSSGFWIEGDLRALLFSNNKIWAALNNDKVKLFSIREKNTIVKGNNGLVPNF